MENSFISNLYDSKEYPVNLPAEIVYSILEYVKFPELIKIYYNISEYKQIVKNSIEKKYPDTYKNSIVEFLTTRIFIDGDIDSFMYLHEKNWIISYEDICNVSIHSGYVDILNFMVHNKLQMSDNILYMATVGNNKDSIEWVRKFVFKKNIRKV